jgi:catechol 2,3-dioxygenase-like lactoylglutathione lyase family enzyme
MTIAVTDLDSMARFYVQVFGARLSRREMGRFALFVGELTSLRLQLCPKELAGIEATQNRHQLTIAVDDVSATIALAQQHGGSKIDESTIRDPDGNSIELTRGM